jgi:hypothetical protein
MIASSSSKSALNRWFPCNQTQEFRTSRLFYAMRSAAVRWSANESVSAIFLNFAPGGSPSTVRSAGAHTDRNGSVVGAQMLLLMQAFMNRCVIKPNRTSYSVVDKLRLQLWFAICFRPFGAILNTLFYELVRAGVTVLHLATGSIASVRSD